MSPKFSKSLIALSILAAAGLAPSVAHAGWIQTAAGTYDFNTVANWADVNAPVGQDAADINGVFGDNTGANTQPLTLTGAQIVTLASSTTTTVPSLNFGYDGAFDITVRAATTGNAQAAVPTLTVNGDITVDSVANNRTISIGTVGAAVASQNEVNVNLGNVTRTITVATGDTLSLGGQVTATAGFTKEGAGKLTFAGSRFGTFPANSIAGTITLNAGTLEIAGNPTAVPNFNGTITLQLNGGNFTAISNASLIMPTNVTTFISGSVGLNQFVNGRDVGFNGVTTINGGAGQTLTTIAAGSRSAQFNGGTNLANTDAAGLTLAGGSNGIFRFVGITQTTNQTVTVNSATNMNIRGALSGSNNTLTLKGAGNALVGESVAVTGSGIQLVVDGLTATFTGAANSYTGGTLLKSGTVIVNNSGSVFGNSTFEIQGGTLRSDGNLRTVSTAPVSVTGGFTIGNGGNGGAAVNFSSAATITNSPSITNNSTDGAFAFDGGTTLTSGFTLTGAGQFRMSGLTLPGDRTLTLNGTGTTTFQGALSGAYNLDLAGTNQNVVLGNLTGSGTVVRVNGASIKVNANNASATFSGGVTLLSGTLQIAANSTGSVTSGPLGTGTLTLGGGTVTTDNAPRTVANAVAANAGNTTFVGNNDQQLGLSGGLSITGSPTLTFNNGNAKVTFSGASSLAGDLTLAGNGSHEFAGQFTISGSRTITSLNNNAIFTGGFTGNGSLIIAGGKTNLNGGTSDYSGTTTINPAATLQTSGANRLSPNSVLVVNGTLDLRGTTGSFDPNRVSHTVAGLTGNGLITNTNGAGGGNEANSTLVINSASTNSFGGTLTGNGRLAIIKQGLGTQEFTGTGNSMDFVTIEAGKILANNTTGQAFGTATTTVKNGGTLGGDGAVDGVTTEAGAILAPGNSPGSLATGVLTLAAGTTYEWELGASAYDVINATNVFEPASGTVTLKLFDDGGTPNPLTQYVVLTYSVRDENANGTGGGTLSTSKWTIDYGSTGWSGGVLTWVGTTNNIDGGQLVLSGLTESTPEIPEPASLSLLALGGLGLLGRRRRA